MYSIVQHVGYLSIIMELFSLLSYVELTVLHESFTAPKPLNVSSAVRHMIVNGAYSQVSVASIVNLGHNPE